MAESPHGNWLPVPFRRYPVGEEMLSVDTTLDYGCDWTRVVEASLVSPTFTPRLAPLPALRLVAGRKAPHGDPDASVWRPRATLFDVPCLLAGVAAPGVALERQRRRW